jgi:DNA-binding SARP family transcriptional activator
VDVRLLGPVELWGTEGKTGLGTPRQRCVLAVLAMSPGQPVPLETLADRVWGDRSPPSFRDVIYSHVSRLRIAVARADGSLCRRDGGYALDVPRDSVDLHRSRRLAAEARAVTAAGGCVAQAVRLWGQACDLWRAVPLTGLSGDWATRTREGLDREHLAMLTERFDLELRCGDPAALIGPLSTALIDYPLAEPLAGQLMIALHREGRQADALAVYARVRSRLVEEIGDEPGATLRALHARILRRDPVLSPRLVRKAPPALSGG